MSTDPTPQFAPAFEGLQEYLPDFVLKLEESDVENYIVDGFVSRRFLVQGRFSQVGYTKAMYSAEDTTVDSLLSSRIPERTSHSLYNGEASGCKFFNAQDFINDSHGMIIIVFLKDQTQLYRRGHHLRLTALPNDLEIVFAYQRPSMWQARYIWQDMIFRVRYADEFEEVDQTTESSNFNHEEATEQFKFTHDTKRFLTAAFAKAVKKKSQFGISVDSIRAMRGLSLVHRMFREYGEAENVLEEA